MGTDNQCNASTKNCPSCSGKGNVRCPDCKGKGRPFDCPTCGDQTNKIEIIGKVICSRCNGSGVVPCV